MQGYLLRWTGNSCSSWFRDCEALWQIHYGEPAGCGRSKQAQWCPTLMMKINWFTTQSFNWNEKQQKIQEYYLNEPQVLEIFVYRE
jgi:hypothetical protein